MNYDLFWKSIILFNLTFSLVWVCFFTYRAPFYNRDDYVDGATGQRGAGNAKQNPDSVLSMPGRSLTFLIAIISSLVLAILFFIGYGYFNKPTLRCKKGKSLKECKLMK